MPTLLESLRAQIADLEHELDVMAAASPQTADHDTKVAYMRSLLEQLKAKAATIR